MERHIFKWAWSVMVNPCKLMTGAITPFYEPSESSSSWNSYKQKT